MEENRKSFRKKKRKKTWEKSLKKKKKKRATPFHEMWTGQNASRVKREKFGVQTQLLKQAKICNTASLT